MCARINLTHKPVFIMTNLNANLITRPTGPHSRIKLHTTGR
jgi:hypothetical protein